jgi:tetratricopeptide (TPR) repeat protein
MRYIIKGLFFACILYLATSSALAGDMVPASPAEAATPAGGDRPIEPRKTAVTVDNERIDSLIREGRSQLAHEEFDSALKSFKEAYELDPQNHKTIHSVMAVHVRKGNYTEAVGFLEQAATRLEQEADRDEIFHIIALIYFKKALKADKNGKGAEAEVSLRKAVSLDPQSAQYLIALARARHKAGSFDEAEKLLAQGLEQSKDEMSRREIMSAREKLRLNEAILRKIR